MLFRHIKIKRNISIISQLYCTATMMAKWVECSLHVQMVDGFQPLVRVKSNLDSKICTCCFPG